MTTTSGAPTAADLLRVHRVLPAQWRAHRDLRLQMLADAPDAFWATLDDVRERTPRQWREEIEGPRIHLQATRGDQVAGGIAVDPIGYTPELLLPEGTVNIVSAYVRPEHRGGGVIRALFAGARDVVRELGGTRMLLETPDDNAPARRRYLSLGFRETGNRFPDPRRDGFHEIESAVARDVPYRSSGRGRPGLPGMDTVTGMHTPQELTSHARPCRRPVVVLDFDGTVGLGDGPIIAYAEGAFRRMGGIEAERARAGFHGWLAGRGTESHPDGYTAVRGYALPYLDAERMGEAFTESRQRLITEDLGIRTPDGVLELLDDLEGTADRVLLTNSPAPGMRETLERLALLERFDQIIVSARKRSRMHEHLQTLLGEQPPHRLVSVGDYRRNDVEAAIEIGAVGMQVTGAWGRVRQPGCPGAAVGVTLADLVPEIRLFAQDPDSYRIPQNRQMSVTDTEATPVRD